MKVKNLHEQPHFLKTLSIGLVGYLQNVKNRRLSQSQVIYQEIK